MTVKTTKKLIDAIQLYRIKNPKEPKISIARKFNVSINTIIEYTNPFMRGENKTIEDIRKEIRDRQYKRICECGTKISVRSNLCSKCYHKKKNKSFTGVFKFKKTQGIIEKCIEAPQNNSYHHFMVDRFNKGKCKYCDKKVDYSSNELYDSWDSLSVSFRDLQTFIY